MFPMNRMDIAKYAVSMVVALKTAKVCQQQVAEHTTLNPDGIPVQVGCWMTGQFVAAKSKPYTDVAVEKTAAWLSDKFNRNDESNEYKSDR